MITFQFLNSGRFRRLSKEGFWVVTGQVVATLGALAGVRVFTELLDTTQYGQLALGLTVAGLVNQVVMGGVTAGIGRFYSIAIEKQDLGGYLHDSRQLMIYATLVVMVIGFVLFGGLLFLGYSQWMGLAAAALVFSILNSFNSTLSGIQNAARRRLIVAFHGGLDAWLKVLLALGVLLWLGNSSTAVIIGYAFSSLLVTGSQLIYLRRMISHQKPVIVDRRWAQQMWAYSWPFSIWGVFTWAQQSSDRWVLQAFTSTEDVGLYAVLLQLSLAPMLVLTGAGIRFISPIMYQQSGEALESSRKCKVKILTYRIVRLCLLATVLFFLLGLEFHDEIFRIMVSEKFRKVSILMPWLILAGGVFAAAQVISVKLESDLKTKTLLRCKIVSAVAGILLSVIGAYYYGVMGTVGGQILFSLFYLALVGYYDSIEVL